jgi:serine/threonine protein kinase/ABC-type branched-subunit amino acid transport system substrate-binding protein
MASLPQAVSKPEGSFGRYRLIADIGSGGMSDVYLAVNEGPDLTSGFRKLFVIKMLKLDLADDPTFLAMFLDEARLAARLNHPNVVQTVEAGESQGRYYLAMEYLEGQPVHRIFQRGDASHGLSLTMRLHMVARALAGLHYAHECVDYDGTRLRIVHRDVSPSNIFVTYQGTVKLMDFGIAKATDSKSETRIGVFKGKAAYMAPEQARGEQVDRQADIYAAGVVLWELVTGVRMWSGLTQLEILQRVAAGKVPPPSSAVSDVAPDLERICVRALAPSKADRYLTARELASDLERFVARLSPIDEQEIGMIIANAFAADRARMRAIIEAQLSRKRSGASSPPNLHFVPEGRTSQVRAFTPSATELSALTTVRGPGESVAPEPNGSTGNLEPGSPSPVTMPPKWKLLAGLALGALLALTVGSALLMVGNRADSPPARAVTPASKAIGPFQRGITDTEIKLGMSAVFSGASGELGQNMKLGLETSFFAANEQGGVYGRKLTLTALDDGYEASRVTNTMKELLENRGVFAFVGNVGTPTSAVAAPFAAQNRTIFFGAFTGAPVLRQDPPDRYVFNYRASYKEETAKSIRYLLDVRKLQPEHIVVFAQEDSFGDAGYEGVTKALRARGRGARDPLRVGYKRNTADVDDAVAAVVRYHDHTDLLRYGPGPNETTLVQRHPVKAVVMVATYRAAAKFIQRVHEIKRLQNVLFFNVSFVGSETLADELKSAEPSVCPNVYVTQVVPPFDSGATGVMRYREMLVKYQPQAHPGFVSLEGYVVGSIFVEGLKRAGRALTAERLVDALEQIDGYDMGLGTKISFSLSEHQASHKIWGTVLDDTCSYRALDLD